MINIKEILILILFALIMYLTYIYWNRYDIKEYLNKIIDKYIYNKTINIQTNKKLKQPKILNKAQDQIKKNNISLINNQNNCNSQIYKIDEIDEDITDMSNNYDIDNEKTTSFNEDNKYDIFDVNENMLDDNLLLTEGALELVDKFVQSKNRPYIFMKIAIDDNNIGNIIFELFNDVVPYTVDNFIYMCNNHYKGSFFHRIIKDFVIQGGDYINHDGTGTNSIYGEKFRDENFSLKHDSPYLLSMANSGPNTNGCQFFITLNNLPHLDNKHVVFGQVVNESSIIVINKLNEVLTNKNNYPLVKCEIIECGLIDH